MNKEELDTKKFEIEKSYMSKEEFINLLLSIDFERIKECSLELITGFIVNLETKEIKPLTKNIDID